MTVSRPSGDRHLPPVWGRNPAGPARVQRRRAECPSHLARERRRQVSECIHGLGPVEACTIYNGRDKAERRTVATRTPPRCPRHGAMIPDPEVPA